MQARQRMRWSVLVGVMVWDGLSITLVTVVVVMGSDIGGSVMVGVVTLPLGEGLMV